jgi:hypothetical protein
VKKWQACAASAAFAFAAAALALAADHDPRITSASPLTTPQVRFPREVHGDAAIAVDQGGVFRGEATPTLVAGSRDLEDESCDRLVGCTLTTDVGQAGVYVSTDGGGSWFRPQYTDASGSPFHTLPGFASPDPAKGLVTHGEPSVAFGPVLIKPPRGKWYFSWSGSRLYYATTVRPEGDNETDVGRVAQSQQLGVARTDDVLAAVEPNAGDAAKWLPLSSAPIFNADVPGHLRFRYRPSIWVDNAQSGGQNPFFGHAYLCWTFLRDPRAQPHVPALGTPSPVMLARSRDGGDHWLAEPVSLPQSRPISHGRQGCTVRTDSQGGVYVAWEEYLNDDAGKYAEEMVTSTDGGVHFSTPVVIARHVVEPGQPDGPNGKQTFDGAGGIRASSPPSIDIANGAPYGSPSGEHPDRIVLAYVSGDELDLSWSDDHGAHWTDAIDVNRSGGRPAYPAVAISPEGDQVYIGYDAFLDPWRATFEAEGEALPRRVRVVSQHISFDALERHGAAAHWRVVKGAVGDARALSLLGLQNELLGERNAATAIQGTGWTALNDARRGHVCAAVDLYRDDPLTAPVPTFADCSSTFGASDLFSAVMTTR